MKENATHIRLIRDENGKPVEAQYDISIDEHIINFREFHSWAEANRIPVAGDWPDREVFAMEEVEPVVLVRGKIDGDKNWYVGTVEEAKYHTDPELWGRKEGVRLKAKQEEQPKSNYEAIEKKMQNFFDTVEPSEVVRMFEEKGYEFEEQPKQEAKTAAVFSGRITVALVRDLLSQVTKGEISFSRMVEVLRETQSSFAKQQYQQEFIEKLESLHAIGDREYAIGYNECKRDLLEILKTDEKN